MRLGIPVATVVGELAARPHDLEILDDFPDLEPDDITRSRQGQGTATDATGVTCLVVSNAVAAFLNTAGHDAAP